MKKTKNNVIAKEDTTIKQTPEFELLQVRTLLRSVRGILCVPEGENIEEYAKELMMLIKSAKVLLSKIK